MINRRLVQEGKMGVFKSFLNKLSLCLFIHLFFFSCSEKKSLEKLNFYGAEIFVPNYLIIDNIKTKSQSCKKNYYLENKGSTAKISFELCSYDYQKRADFDLLNEYFEEGINVMKNEFLEFKLINKTSHNKNDHYYEFTYEFFADGKFYLNTRFAYKNFYIGVKIEASSEDEMRDLSRSLKYTRRDNFLSDFESKDSEGNSICFSCNFPSPW